LLFAHKTSEQDGRVLTTEIESALKRLDINQIYAKESVSTKESEESEESEKSEELLQRKITALNKLAEDFQNGKLTGIIRMLIAIPRYQRECQQMIEEARNESSIKANDIKYKTIEIPQCLLVTTEENLATYGLFHKHLVQFLTERFKCETTRGTKRKLEEIQTESEEESEEEQVKKKPKQFKVIH
jgi:hypothetical protein